MDDKTFRVVVVALLSTVSVLLAGLLLLLVFWVPEIARFEYRTLKELQGVPREVYEENSMPLF